jgi:hypothetical protein
MAAHRRTLFLGSEGFNSQLQDAAQSATWLGARRPLNNERKGRDSSTLPRASSSSVEEKAGSVESLLPIKAGDIREAYQMRYHIQLGGSVAIHQKKPATFESFGIRKISGHDEEEKQHKVYILSLIRHQSFLHCYEVFNFEQDFYTVSEDMAISCDELVSSPQYPEEVHLAAIFCQVSNSNL